jgi:hypothetical protein
MSLLLPSRRIDLPGGYRWEPNLVDLEAWQAHLLKHPLGLWATRELGRSWDHESWTKTTPPVLDEQKRSQLFAAIAQASSAANACAVPEVFGVQSSQETEPQCYRCKAPLLTQCFGLMNSIGISPRYAELTEQVVASLSEGEAVERRALAATLQRTARRMEDWSNLVVMAVGNLGREAGHGLRLTRGDGIRVELRLGLNHRLQWRTTYRIPEIAAHSGAWGYLLKLPDPAPKLSLSDVYVVPRAWWQEHGS